MYHRGTQTLPMDSILEEQPQPSVEFREYFGKKQLNKQILLDINSNSTTNNLNDLVYLKKNYSLMNSKDKQTKEDSDMKLIRDEQILLDNKKPFNVNNRVYEERNPAINKLTADVRGNTALSQLQEDLKKEFDFFLTMSMKKTTESFKNLSRPESARRPNQTFLTQDNEETAETLDDLLFEQAESVNSVNLEKSNLERPISEPGARSVREKRRRLVNYVFVNNRNTRCFEPRTSKLNVLYMRYYNEIYSSSN